MSAVRVPELFVLIAIVLMAVALVWPAARICRRLGFSPWLGIFIVVPLANILLLWFVAFTEWPSRKPA